MESGSSEGRSEVIKLGPGRFETCTVWSGSILVSSELFLMVEYGLGRVLDSKLGSLEG